MSFFIRFLLALAALTAFASAIFGFIWLGVHYPGWAFFVLLVAASAFMAVMTAPRPTRRTRYETSRPKP